MGSFPTLPAGTMTTRTLLVTYDRNQQITRLCNCRDGRKADDYRHLISKSKFDSKHLIKASTP